MAVEMKFIPKKEGDHMAKFRLTERISVYVDPKSGEERIANMDPKSGDKDNVFLLGGVGQEIDMDRAEKLGLSKPAESESAKKAGNKK